MVQASVLLYRTECCDTRSGSRRGLGICRDLHPPSLDEASVGPPTSSGSVPTFPGCNTNSIIFSVWLGEKRDGRHCHRVNEYPRDMTEGTLVNDLKKDL